MISPTAVASIANLTIILSGYDAVPLENCTDDVHELRQSYLPPLYGITFLVGFPGNLIVIYVYAFKMRPWKSTTVIMFNLASTDLLYLVTLPFLIHYYASGEDWIFGDFLCKFIRFSFHFNLYSSILFLTCFSIFRYFAVVHPIRSFSVQKKSWAILACVASWVFSLLAVSPINYLITSEDSENKSFCHDLMSSEKLDVIRWYTWLLSSLVFFLPLIIVTLCYAAIICTLATGMHTQNRYKQKARKLACLLLVVFSVCFLPFHVLRILRIELRLHPVKCELETHVHTAYVISRPLAAMNTCCNLLLYAVINDNFRQAFPLFLRCKLSSLMQQMGTGSNTDFNKSGQLKL
uniref:2-oxoglutarate receptor 1-like n=1 Tax=Pogona vitticeps TaxID=103695 RepID=A0A6J0SRZ8_9SAUR